MTNKVFKRLATLTLAFAMVFGFMGTAFADSYNVHLYKANHPNQLSMADAIIDGQATVTELSNGQYKIEIPIKPIYNYKKFFVKADGYLNGLTITQAINQPVVTEKTAPIYGGNDSNMYGQAKIVFNVSNLSANNKYNVVSSKLNLYKVGTDKKHWFNHIKPKFIIGLE